MSIQFLQSKKGEHMPKRLSQEDARGYIGNRYNNLIVTDVFKKNNVGEWYAICLCDCGNNYTCNLSGLKRNKYKHCTKCAYKERAKSISLAQIKKSNMGVTPYPQWFIEDLVNDDDKQKALKGTLEHTKKVLFHCREGHPDFYQEVSSHINLKTLERRFRCPECKKIRIGYCSKKALLKNRIEFPDWFLDSLVNEDDKIRAREKRILCHDRLQFHCNKCGNVFFKAANKVIDFKSGERKIICVNCHKKEKKALTRKEFPEWFINELVDETSKELARKKLLSATDIVKFCCSKGHIYEQRVCDHINLTTMEKRFGCKICGYSKVSKDMANKFLKDRPEYPQWFIDDIVKQEDKERALKRTLTGDDKILLYCSSCHKAYEQTVSNRILISTGERKAIVCQDCCNRVSSEELELRCFISSIYSGKILYNVRNIIHPYELDIFIPEKRIGIEYNGSYWHRTLPSGESSKDQFYHVKKFHDCLSKNIHLISIFDVDWNSNCNKIKQYLVDMICDNNCINLNSDNCSLFEVNTCLSDKMYNCYHLFGSSLSDVSYGLFYNNNLVSCMSFCKEIVDNKLIWILTRFVEKQGYKIQGGYKKILMHFEKFHKPRTLKCFSNNDYYDCNLLHSLGFCSCNDENKDNYYWFYNNNEICKDDVFMKKLSSKDFNILKECLDFDGSDEDYLMLKLGAFKVYRSGYSSWIKNYSNNEE